MNQKQLRIVGFAIVAVMVAGIIASLGGCEASRTQRIVEAEAKTLLSNTVDKVASPQVVKDAWGRDLEYTVDRNEEAILVTVRSSGADGKFGTTDDIGSMARDYNTSRAIGRWAASKAKELTKGIWDGLKDESVFKED